MAIASGKTLADEKRLRHETAELYIKSFEEMAAAFVDCPEVVANMLRIAEQAQAVVRELRPLAGIFA